MSKYMKKTDEARLQGMQMALRIAEKCGVEALRQEVTRRGINQISLPIGNSQMVQEARKMHEKEWEFVSMALYDTFRNKMNLSAGTVKDYLNYFNQRVDDFRDSEEELQKTRIQMETDSMMCAVLENK